MLRLAKDKKKRSSATALTPSQTTEVEEAGAVASDPSSDGKGSKRMDDDGIRYRRGNAVSSDQGSVVKGSEGSAKAEYEHKTRGFGDERQGALSKNLLEAWQSHRVNARARAYEGHFDYMYTAKLLMEAVLGESGQSRIHTTNSKHRYRKYKNCIKELEEKEANQL